MAMPGQPGERAGGGETAELAPVEPRAPGERLHVVEAAASRRASTRRPAAAFGETLHETQTQPQGEPAPPSTGSSVQSQSLASTSTGRTSTPWRRASCTSCEGA